MTRDVILFAPTGGWVRSEFLTSALHVMTDPGVPVAEFREITCGPVMGQARCEITREFLKTPHEWLLMIDSDMVFTAGTICALRKAADAELRPVMGAFCVTMSDEGKYPTMYRADRNADGEFGFTSWAPGTVPRDAVVEVDATGAGCLLIHRSVFKRLEEYDPANRGLWFAEMTADHRLFGEDFSFCMRCRIAGVPLHVCTAARTGHVKNVILGEAGP